MFQELYRQRSALAVCSCGTGAFSTEMLPSSLHYFFPMKACIYISNVGKLCNKMITNSVWAMGETNLGENISLTIETLLASSNYDTKMK